MAITDTIRRMPVSLRLVCINATVLIVVAIISFASGIARMSINPAIMFLDIPAGLKVLQRPWTVITYMFTQTDVWHCIFNMLWLYWFGILWERFSSGRRLLWLYITGGLGGAVAFFLLTLSVTHDGMYLEGASAAVMGVVTATAIMIPDYRMNLFLLGQVKLKWIAVATVLLFAIGASGPGATAHLGGVIAGAIYALWLKYIHNRPRISQRSRINTTDARAELDSLLDKVRTSGYGSLTANERRRLFELSHRI